MSAFRFEAHLAKVGSVTVLRLPEDASGMLPPRGQTMLQPKCLHGNGSFKERGSCEPCIR